MNCPRCQVETLVTDSRTNDALRYVRRRRICPNGSCKYRFTTYEKEKIRETESVLKRRMLAIRRIATAALDAKEVQ